MVEKKLTVKNKTGLHARPASQLVRKCSKFKSKIYIKTEDKEVNAKSIINILSAGITQGTKIILCTEGEDEVEALEVIANFINDLVD
jgi:phosphocarrier protein HPr